MDELEELKRENKHLNDLLNGALKDYDELLKRVDKAIEWANTHDVDDCWELLEILERENGDSNE